MNLEDRGARDIVYLCLGRELPFNTGKIYTLCEHACKIANCIKTDMYSIHTPFSLLLSALQSSRAFSQSPPHHIFVSRPSPWKATTTPIAAIPCNPLYAVLEPQRNQSENEKKRKAKRQANPFHKLQVTR